MCLQGFRGGILLLVVLGISSGGGWMGGAGRTRWMVGHSEFVNVANQPPRLGSIISGHAAKGILVLTNYSTRRCVTGIMISCERKRKKNKKEIRRKSFTIGNASKYPWRIIFYGEFGGMASSGGVEISFFSVYPALEFCPFSSRLPLSYLMPDVSTLNYYARDLSKHGGTCLPY